MSFDEIDLSVERIKLVLVDSNSNLLSPSFDCTGNQLLVEGALHPLPTRIG